MRVASLLAFGLLTAFPVSGGAANFGLPVLMNALAQVRAANAQFVERKTLAVLNTPLVSSGTLSYVAPDELTKTTISPAPETFVLDHGVITLTGPDGQVHRVLLADDPRIASLIEGIRATLAGDLRTLQRLYTIRISGTQAGWQLLLRPVDPNVAHLVAWIAITGRQNRIDAIDTAGGNGDHSEMSVTETEGDAN